MRAAIGPRTRSMLLMSASMPSGGLLYAEDCVLVAEISSRTTCC